MPLGLTDDEQHTIDQVADLSWWLKGYSAAEMSTEEGSDLTTDRLQALERVMAYYRERPTPRHLPGDGPLSLPPLAMCESQHEHGPHVHIFSEALGRHGQRTCPGHQPGWIIQVRP